MKLSEYLARHETTRYALAKRTGLDWRTLDTIVNTDPKKRVVPRRATAQLIELATDGEVTADEVMAEASGEPALALTGTEAE